MSAIVPEARNRNIADLIFRRYIGKLTNGKQFDANTAGSPFSFVLGRGEVIKGWDEGLKGMHVGGERKLEVRSGPVCEMGSSADDRFPPTWHMGSRTSPGFPRSEYFHYLSRHAPTAVPVA